MIFNKRKPLHQISYLVFIGLISFLPVRQSVGQISPFKIADQLPTFPGGDLALQKYIANHLLVPQNAISNQVNGDVVLDFIVNEDGSISDIEILEEIGYGCGDASINLIKGMPAWIPGKRNGKPVKLAYTLSIPFQLKPQKATSPNKRVTAKIDRKSVKEYTSKHQTIAIIPADIVINDRKPFKNKNSDPEKLIDQQKELQTKVQHLLYQRLKWLKENKRIKNINIQDISITNQLLERNDVENMQDMKEIAPNKLAAILGVDGIVSCSGIIDQMLSKGGALALATFDNRRSVPANDLYNFTLNIFDGDDGELIWSATENLSNKLILKKRIKIIEEILKHHLTINFPYRY